MNYGFNVRIVFKEDSPYGKTTENYHNVTEIHYSFPSPLPELRIAFESDIHGTGCTQRADYIEEFEAIIATRKFTNF